jgi:hypothetical protein
MFQANAFQDLPEFVPDNILEQRNLLILNKTVAISQSDLTNLNLIILDNIILSNVNLFDSQVPINFFRIAQVLSVADNLTFDKQPQAVSIKY